MNKDRLFLTIVISVLVLGAGFGIYLTRIMQKNTYHLVVFPQYAFCYLVQDKYSVTAHNEGFRYESGTSQGNVERRSGKLTNKNKIPHDDFDVMINSPKVTNSMTLQYKVADGIYFEDSFLKESGGEPFLLPKKKKCDFYASKIDKQIIINFD
jgi:hypothetical protein